MAETRAVAKAILVAGDKILLLRRSADDFRRPLQWDLPGGALDPGEDVKQACAREVQEEAGITVAVGDFKAIYAMTEVVEGDVSCTFSFFRAAIAETEATISHEHSDYKWMTLAEALEVLTYERHQRVLTYVQEHDLLTAKTSD